MTDWIQGQKFIGIADFVFAPEGSKDCNTLTNTFCPLCLKEKNIIYTHTMYVKQLFDKIKGLNCEFIIISHNCDTNVDDSFIVPDNVTKWFSQNVNVINPKIESIPIGLENDRWFKGIRKKEKMDAKLKEPKRYKNLVYMNFNISTNPAKRQVVYDLFKDKPWVTVDMGVNGQDFDKYLDNIYNHKFVLCPEGNGIDTHRIWETLYMNSIPLVDKNINTEFYYGVTPMLLCKDWSFVVGQKSLLEEMFDSGFPNWRKDILKFQYWKEKILTEKYVSNTGIIRKVS